MRPETIENRWDILYRDYPEVYDEFAKVKATPQKHFGKMLGAKGKTVVDVACGTGKSTFSFARYAAKVIGIEPEEAMLKIARENLKKEGYKNVVFLKGTTDDMPVPDHSVDIVAAITSASLYNADNIERFAKESKHILVEGGYIYSVDEAPGWYGGELAPIILGRSRRIEPIDYDFVRNEAFKARGFQYKDFYKTRQYDSLEHVLSTYGFIFGKKAIEYIKANNTTSIKFKLRIYSKKI